MLEDLNCIWLVHVNILPSYGYDNYLMIICREIDIEAVKYFCRRLKAVQYVDHALIPRLTIIPTLHIIIAYKGGAYYACDIKHTRQALF